MARKIRCWGCGMIYIPSRSDQLFCSRKCRCKYNYVHVPKCNECDTTDCKIRNNSKKYAPKECPLR